MNPQAISTIHSRVLDAIMHHGMFAGCRRVVLAVSGGADSLALMHLITELQRQHFSAVALEIGHLHHGMRGAEADADAEFVSAQARRLGLECTVERCDVPALAHELHIGEEEAGRKARYDFLRKLAAEHDATRIVTGHHADDQAETVLMRVLRGAGPRGMAAIPPTRSDELRPEILIVRPLLYCTRGEIERFLESRNLTPRLDRTNLSSRYLRNRIRRLMPLLEKEWGENFREQLCALATSCNRFHGYTGNIVRALTERHSVILQPHYVETSANWLDSIPTELLAELMRHWMESAGIWQRTPSRTHYECVRRFLSDAPDGEADKGRAQAALPGGVLACRAGDVFILCPQAEPELKDFSTLLRAPGLTPVPPIGASVAAEIIPGNSKTLGRRIARKDRFEEFMDFDRLQPPLVLRFPRPGDRMHPLGAPGRRKVQDILTDLHIPRLRKRRTLLLTMADRTIWIAGWRIAEAVRLKPSSRMALRLRLCRGVLRS